MPRISPERQQSRYDAILQAGRAVLGAKQFEKASIADIARCAGVSEGLIYRYFADKRALLMAVLADFYERIIEDLDGVLRETTGFSARLRALIVAHVRLFASDTEMCRLFLTEVRVASDYRDTAIYQLNRRYTSAVLQLAAEGVAEGVVRLGTDGRVLRDMLFGGIEHFAWRYIRNPGAVDLEEGAERIAEILLHGIGAVKG